MAITNALYLTSLRDVYHVNLKVLQWYLLTPRTSVYISNALIVIPVSISMDASTICFRGKGGVKRRLTISLQNCIQSNEGDCNFKEDRMLLYTD